MSKIEAFFEGRPFYWEPIGFTDKIVGEDSTLVVTVIEWGFWSFILQTKIEN